LTHHHCRCISFPLLGKHAACCTLRIAHSPTACCTKRQSSRSSDDVKLDLTVLGYPTDSALTPFTLSFLVCLCLVCAAVQLNVLLLYRVPLSGFLFFFSSPSPQRRMGVWLEKKATVHVKTPGRAREQTYTWPYTKRKVRVLRREAKSEGENG
jgi:hypothetical protein